jgi:hypothetical protein
MKSRQLPKHTSPQHLPKLTRQLPSSIESAASTFTSLFGRRNKNQENQQQQQQQQQENLPIVSDAYMGDGYVDYSQSGAYNENYNYAYRSMDSADELMLDDGDNNNLINGRLGAALPTLPYNNFTSEPGNHAIPSIDVQYDQNAYYGDEYYDSSMYKSGLTPSPKRSKVWKFLKFICKKI